MFRKKFIAIIGSVFLILISACNLPGVPAVVSGTNQDPPSAIQTQAAGIVASTAAAHTALSNAVASSLASTITNTPEFTFTIPYSHTDVQSHPVCPYCQRLGTNQLPFWSRHGLRCPRHI